MAEQWDKTQGAAPPHPIPGCKGTVSIQDHSMGAQPQDSSLCCTSLNLIETNLWLVLSERSNSKPAGTQEK